MTSFAVVVPVHNKERHIERTLRSILDQTHPPREIILVDDASVDQSVPRARAFDDVRIRILRRDTPGPGGYAARNLAIRSAQSDWIAFLDADDSWHPEHLARLSAVIESHDCVSAFSAYEFVEPGGYRIADRFSRQGHAAGSFSPEASMQIWLDSGCPMWTGAVAARRETLIAVDLFPEGRCRRGGDRDLWLRLLLAGGTAYSDKPTATYHRDADNMLTKSETFSARQCVLDTILAEIPGQGAQVQDLLKRIFNREVYQYVLKAWKAGTPVSIEMIRGYFTSHGLGTYALVQAMRHLPLPLNDGIRQRIKATKGGLRRMMTGARRA